MRARLFIRLPEDPAQPVSWLLLEPEKESTIPAEFQSEIQSEIRPDTRAGSQAALEDISLHAPGRHVIVLVPTAQVLLTHARIPSRQRQRILSALPYALEDQLAEDVEQLHFALGQRNREGDVQVAVVSRRRLGEWLARLRACDIEPDAVVPDALCLPWEEGQWSALQEAHQLLLRTAAQEGLSLDSDSLDVTLPLLLAESEENREKNRRPSALHWYVSPDGGSRPPPALEAPGLESVDILPHPLEEAPLALLSRHYRRDQAINLLQGEYSRHEQLGRYWRPWRPAAALLLALLLLLAGTTVLDYLQLSEEHEALRQRIERIYLDTFPEARRVVNPRVQMERRLAALRTGETGAGGFLDLLREAGPALRETPKIELRRISFRDGRLDIALRIPDLQSLDRLKQRLGEKAGLRVDIQSATARDDKVEARLQIRPSRDSGRGGAP